METIKIDNTSTADPYQAICAVKIALDIYSKTPAADKVDTILVTVANKKLSVQFNRSGTSYLVKDR